jgi:hypothetical protein
MTRFLAEARKNPDRPTWFEHTFYVETVVCDEAARRARELAVKWPPDSDPDPVRDPVAWVYLARVNEPNGPDLTAQVREWQRQWLRDYAGMAEEDRSLHSIRSVKIG